MIFNRLGLCGDGGEHDESTAGREIFVGLLGDEELASSVDGENAVEFFGSDLGDVPKCFDAGVGDYDVDVLEVCVGGVEKLHDVGGLGDVCCDCDGFVAEGFDGFDDLWEIRQRCFLKKREDLRVAALGVP
jgi:hypothetical protein